MNSRRLMAAPKLRCFIVAVVPRRLEDAEAGQMQNLLGFADFRSGVGQKLT